MRELHNVKMKRRHNFQGYVCHARLKYCIFIIFSQRVNASFDEFQSFISKMYDEHKLYKWNFFIANFGIYYVIVDPP